MPNKLETIGLNDTKQLWLWWYMVVHTESGDTSAIGTSWFIEALGCYPDPQRAAPQLRPASLCCL